MDEQKQIENAVNCSGLERAHFAWTAQTAVGYGRYFDEESREMSDQEQQRMRSLLSVQS